MKVKTLKRNAKETEMNIKHILIDFMEKNDVSVLGVELDMESIQRECDNVNHLLSMDVNLIIEL